MGVLAVGSWEAILPSLPQDRRDLEYKVRLTSEPNGAVFGEIVPVVKNGSLWEEANGRATFGGLAAAGRFFAQQGSGTLSGSYALSGNDLTIDWSGGFFHFSGVLTRRW